MLSITYLRGPAVRCELWGSDHIDAGFGDDVIEVGDHSDLILGGPGADEIYGDTKDGTSAHPGADEIHGGPGADTIDGGPGDDRILGGPDDDTLRGGPGKDVILGSVGNDVIEGGDEADWLGGEAGDDTIRGGAGSDRIHPGLGRDEAYGEAGDDTIIIPDPCEIVAGGLVDGGPGFDRVVSPLSEAELVERGVRFTAIEEFVVRSSSTGKTCRAQDPQPRMIEASGTVIATTTLFRDEQGALRPPDGLFHNECSPNSVKGRARAQGRTQSSSGPVSRRATRTPTPTYVDALGVLPVETLPLPPKPQPDPPGTEDVS